MTNRDSMNDARSGILLVDQLSPESEDRLKRLKRLTGKSIKDLRTDALKKGVDAAYLHQFFGQPPAKKLTH